MKGSQKMTKKLTKKYKMNSKFYEMHPETQSILNIIMSILATAHHMDVQENMTGRDLLKAYSPDNQLLEFDEFIGWNEAMYWLITDVIEEKDLLSEVSNARYIH